MSGAPRPRAPGGGAPRRGKARADDGRARALAVLLEVERGRRAVDLLGPDDTPFVRELVLGVLRRRLTLDAVHDAWGRRPAAALDPDVLQVVRLGLHQYLFLDGVPPHAIVSATVAALRPSARGYANALLRSVLRESRKLPEERDRGGASPTKRLHRPGRAVVFFSRAVFPDPERDRLGWLSVVHSHPRFLVERWVARQGEAQAVARMEAANATPPLTLRPRAGRVTADGLAERLAREGVATERIARPDGDDALLVRPGKARLLATASFAQGLFSVQDAAQMDAAEILDPRPGEQLWDACAAPGGKACQLAERLLRVDAGGSGRLLATDVSEPRLRRAQEHAARLGLDERVRFAVHDLLDTLAPPGRPAPGFDAILLDAPCSNTAVLGRRPEARWRVTPEAITELAALQRRLLASASRHLAPGGRLVYSVCSHEPEEAGEHGLRATRSELVFVADAAHLRRLVAGWEGAVA